MYFSQPTALRIANCDHPKHRFASNKLVAGEQATATRNKPVPEQPSFYFLLRTVNNRCQLTVL